MEPRYALLEAVRDVADFPQPGIIFKDITPILASPKLLKIAIDELVLDAEGLGATKIAGIDARGFLFGSTVAYQMGLGFIPIRKKGKLPWKTESLAYNLEYGTAEVEVHTDAFEPEDRVILIDDLLATGGTAGAATKLIQRVGATVIQAQFLVELSFLKGRDLLSPVPVKSLVTY